MKPFSVQDMTPIDPSIWREFPCVEPFMRGNFASSGMDRSPLYWGAGDREDGDSQVVEVVAGGNVIEIRLASVTGRTKIYRVDYLKPFPGFQSKRLDVKLFLGWLEGVDLSLRSIATLASLLPRTLKEVV